MKRNIVYSENFDANVCIQEFVNFANYMNECVSHLRNVFYKKTTFKDISSEKQTTDFITIPEGIH
jgi:SAM-dependent MidA family methyltransferase